VRFYVLCLRPDELPNLVNLNPLARQVPHVVIHVLRADRSELDQKFRNGVLAGPGHANRGADRTALNQASDDLPSLAGVEAVHTHHYT